MDLNDCVFLILGNVVHVVDAEVFYFYFFHLYLSWCVFVGRSVSASVTREPGWFFRSPLSVLRPRHTHALPCREGGSLKAARPSLNMKLTVMLLLQSLLLSMSG